MKDIKNKEKIVRDLMNTFNDRDELHIAYKEKMKHIIFCAFYEFTQFSSDNIDSSHFDLRVWIDKFVEERFKPRE